MRDTPPVAPVSAPERDLRGCTCHPDDNPPTPCPRKYALSECRIAALESTVQDLRAECERLRALVANLGTETKTLHELLDVNRAENERAQAEIDRLERERAKAEFAWRDKIMQLERKLDAAVKRLAQCFESL